MKELKNILNVDMVSQLDKNLYCQQLLKDVPFEDRYLKLREQEQRIYEKEALRNLPEVPPYSPYFQEWKIRGKSAENVASYLNTRPNVTNILEIGCGNGWLSNFLARRGDFNIVGLDVNSLELKQASQAFSASQNVQFVYGNIFDALFIGRSFDVVILAASIQYFKDVERLFNRIFELLKKDGEIHIFDSPIYQVGQVPAARSRSVAYFNSLGHPEMSNYYFHHSFDMLDKFKFEIMYDPSLLKNRILRKWFVNAMSPFPWLRIQGFERPDDR